MADKLVPPTHRSIACQATRAGTSCVDARDSGATTKSMAFRNAGKPGRCTQISAPASPAGRRSVEHDRLVRLSQFPVFQVPAHGPGQHHPRHVPRADRSPPRQSGKRTFLPAQYESKAIMTRVTARFD